MTIQRLLATAITLTFATAQTLRPALQGKNEVDSYDDTTIEIVAGSIFGAIALFILIVHIYKGPCRSCAYYNTARTPELSPNSLANAYIYIANDPQANDRHPEGYVPLAEG